MLESAPVALPNTSPNISENRKNTQDSPQMARKGKEITEANQEDNVSHHHHHHHHHPYKKLKQKKHDKKIKKMNEKLNKSTLKQRRKWKLTWMWGSLPKMQPNNDLMSISSPSLDEINSNDLVGRPTKSFEPLVNSSNSVETNNSDSLFHSCSGTYLCSFCLSIPFPSPLFLSSTFLIPLPSFPFLISLAFYHLVLFCVSFPSPLFYTLNDAQCSVPSFPYPYQLSLLSGAIIMPVAILFPLFFRRISL